MLEGTCDSSSSSGSSSPRPVYVCLDMILLVTRGRRGVVEGASKEMCLTPKPYILNLGP